MIEMALIAAAGASAFGSIKGGYQQARALNYQAKINERMDGRLTPERHI